MTTRLKALNLFLNRIDNVKYRFTNNKQSEKLFSVIITFEQAQKGVP